MAASRGTWVRAAKDFLLVSAGVLSAGLGLKGFLFSSRFIDGGVTGVSMLLADLTPWPLWVLIPLINLPFVALGYRQIGRGFALKSVAAIAGLALCLAVVPYPDVTPDLLLTAVFGGFFIGAGIGLSMRGGAVLDGTEIAALLVSRRSDLLRVSDIILLLNIVIFSVAAFFLGVEIALYSILTYFAASRTLEFVLYGLEEYTALIIVSDQSEAIRQAITQSGGRGVTVYEGRKGWSEQRQDILFCVTTRLETGRIRTLVRQLDPAAFVVVHPLSDVEGGLVKRPNLH